MNKKEKELASAMMRQLAELSVGKKQSKKLAKTLATNKFTPDRIDVCSVGICPEYLLNPEDLCDFLRQAVLTQGIHRIDTFPLGTLDPRLFMVQTPMRVRR